MARKPKKPAPKSVPGVKGKAADVQAPEGTPVAYPHTADALAPIPHGGGFAYVRTEMASSEPAPASTSGAVAWMRQNLFSSIPNTILTLFALFLLYILVPPLVNFVFIDAVSEPASRSDRP